MVIGFEDILPEGWGWDLGLTDVAAWAIDVYPATHPGASNCIRSSSTQPVKTLGGVVGLETQQCCYKDGKLITDGTGAGTPDYNTPNHTVSDVNPWKCAAMLDGNHVNGKAIIASGTTMDEYLKRRPPNNGNNCEKLGPSGICVGLI